MEIFAPTNKYRNDLLFMLSHQQLKPEKKDCTSFLCKDWAFGLKKIQKFNSEWKRKKADKSTRESKNEKEQALRLAFDNVYFIFRWDEMRQR